MEISFDAIGLEISNETALNTLLEDAKTRGEVSHLVRETGVLHGRCWRLGAGLEVWTVLYESEDGEIFHADCRPAFRARLATKINPWILTEFDKSGDALMHGYIFNTNSEILFSLQNLTEATAANFRQKTLTVGLCGLAHQASITRETTACWKSAGDHSKSAARDENIWSLCGEIIDFSTLRNPFSGNDLFWILVKLADFQLEILVNQRTLKGDNLHLGAMIKADVWLQGHLIGETLFPRYEGIDYRFRTVDFWQKLKKQN